MDMDLEKLEGESAAAANRAREVLQETGVVEAWEGIGAEVNVVGSLAMGLIMRNRDVDLHVYTDPLRIEDDFAAMGRWARRPQVRSIVFGNLLDAEDRCLEWHATVEVAPGETWKFDMIHIVRGSRYDGHFERVAERVRGALTPETRGAILSIKRGLAAEEGAMGIEVYQAVLGHGVRGLEEFRAWRRAHPPVGIIDWMP